MVNLGRQLFSITYPYANPIERQRARGLLILNWVIFVGALLSVVRLVLINFDVSFNSFALMSAVLTLVAPFICLINFFWLQRGRLVPATWLFILLLTVGTGIVVTGGFQGSLPLLLIIPLVAAASFLGRRGLLLIVGLLFLFIFVGAVAQSRQPDSYVLQPNQNWQTDMIVALISISLGTFFLYTFNGLTQRLARENYRELGFMRQIAQFSTLLSGKDEESIYAESIRFARTQLGYAFAQVFFVGADGKLSRRLRVGTGVRTTTEQATDVSVADGSAVIQAAAIRQAVVVSQEDIPLRWSHFLPSTTYGVALPILSQQNQLIAILDVQSEQLTPFTRDQLSALNALVEAVGGAATQSRLVQALRQNIRQQEEVTTTLRARLQELRQGLVSGVGLAGELGSSWNSYLQQRGQDVFGFDLEGKNQDSERLLTAASDLPDTLRAVLETGALQVTTQGEVKVVNVPISLRGEVLGAMSFTITKDRVLTERQIETAQIVANRLALALENKRLFEQTQAQAVRERRANEATNLLISATNVEAVMNVAAASFNEALGAIHTRIHLQPSVMNEKQMERREVVS